MFDIRCVVNDKHNMEAGQWSVVSGPPLCKFFDPKVIKLIFNIYTYSV